MAISSNFPALKTSLLLDFANSQQLDPRITFSRSTTAQYYDGKTSVLAEQNLLKNSQVFTSVWAIPNTTVTANSITAPDGTTTGSTLTDSAVTNNFQVQQSLTGSAGAYTGSMYFQAGTIGFAYIQVTDATFRYTVLINLATGAFANSSSTGSPTGTSYTITQSGSWYRLAVTVNLTGSTVYMIGGLSNSATPTFSFGSAVYTGTGTGTIYVWGAQLEQRSSATAYNITTTSAITNYIPQLLTAPINAPRFDFNPVTGESLGLLIEQSSTNILIQSQDFTNGAWTQSGLTITASANIAPDGTQTAQLLSATSASYFVYQNGSYYVSGTTYTNSYYVKAVSGTTIAIYNSALSGYAYANFNLSTQTATIGAGIANSGFVTPVGNGWYRIGFSFTANQTGTFNTQLHNATAGGSTTDKFYIWGAQLEALAFPTSYVPTTSAQVTRASDNASMTGTNFSSWYNNQQGTLFVDAVSSYGSGSTWAVLASLESGSSSYANSLIIRRTSNTTLNTYLDYNGSGVNLGGSVTTSSSAIKVAVSLNAGNYIQSVNGATASTSSTPTNMIPNITKLDIGYYSTLNTYYLNGWVKKLAYYPQSTTATNVQSLTGS